MLNIRYSLIICYKDIDTFVKSKANLVISLSF